MDQTEMKAKLSEREKALREEILDMEKSFNVKKEEYLKVQGALEALTILEQSGESSSTPTE